MRNQLAFKKLDDRAVLPIRHSEASAGLDLHCIEDTTIEPGKWASVRTGIAVAIPVGWYGRVAPRSGLAKTYGINILGGVIDSDYRGELVCILINHGSERFKINSGGRVAQLIIERCLLLEPCWIDSLPTSGRGESGFGSSGL